MTGSLTGSGKTFSAGGSPGKNRPAYCKSNAQSLRTPHCLADRYHLNLHSFPAEMTDPEPFALAQREKPFTPRSER